MTPKVRALAAAVAALLIACGDAGDAADTVPGDAADAGAADGADHAAQEGIDVRGLGHDVGDPEAPIVVIEFSDFGCPYCARFGLETFPGLEREFVSSGAVLWRFVPFVMGNFPNSRPASVAAECAAEQDRFWPMHDRLYDEQRAWKAAGQPAALFRAWAVELGLDGAAFERCLDGGAAAARVARHDDVARQAGVRATPTFFINGVRAEGALPAEQFRMLFQRLSAPRVGPARPRLD